MASLESLIESYVDSQKPPTIQASSAKAISKEVLEGRLTIQSLVLTLGTYLTTTDNIVRARGTLLLSDILADLSQSPLENTAIKSLTNFYSARLGDWHCLRGAVLGSLYLLRRKSSVGAVDKEEASEVARSALTNLHVQALAQRDRMICLELFECLLEKHANAVAPLEGDLLFGVVAAVEEEKDPRCLLFAFRIIQLLARLYPDPNGPIASCADELFDVVSRYFPISFNPQPNSPDGITREDLATALKEAFTCTPIFAPFCIPLLLEKLSSSLRSAKLDALNYLSYCALKYGPKVLSQHTDQVWEALKPILLPLSFSEPQDVEMVKEASACLRTWVSVFQRDSSLEPGDFLRLTLQDALVEDLITCLKNDTDDASMQERGRLQAEAAGRVIAESAHASTSSCFLICEQVLPQVMAASGGGEAIENQRVIGLEVAVKIVVAARDLAENVFLEKSDGAWLEPLREQSESLICAFHHAIASTDSSVLGVAGLQALASFPAPCSPLNSSQLRKILLILKDLLIEGTEEKHVFTALESISAVEQQSGSMDGDVGILTVVVPDLLGAVREGKAGKIVGKPLKVVAKICGSRPVGRQLVISHLTESLHLDLSVIKGNEAEELCAKLVVVLQSLSEDILPWCDDEGADQLVTMKLSTEIWRIVSTDAVKCSQEVLEWSLKAMRGAVVKCDATIQSKILETGVELLLDTTPRHQMDWSIALLASVIVSLRPNTRVPKKETTLSLLMNTAQSQKPLLVTETSAQAVASVLNKWVVGATNEADGFTLDKAVSVALSEGCLSLISSTSNLEDVSKVSRVRAAAWIGKGLAMRGHNGVSDVASTLLRLLLSGASKEEEKRDLAMAAAAGLGIILKDSDVCLSKAHHAVIRPLYKQRFFSSMLPPLLEAVRSSSDTQAKLWLYRGMGQLISGTPHVALLADGAKVFPVILGTLSFLCSDPSDSDLLLSTLLALSAFLVDSNQGRPVAAEHVSSIVKRMLTLIQYRHSVVVRETALQCLGAVVGLPYTRVYPLRTQVLKALSAALDDRKRVVRKEAVRCRQAWTLIASK